MIVKITQLFIIIVVVMIAKFEKSEFSIRLADNMDKMDRTWELFTDHLIRNFIRKVRSLSGLVTNGKVRSVIRIFCNILYYQAILLSAFFLTRDDLSHNWRIDWRDTNMEVYEYRKHFEEYFVLFLIMNH